MNSLPPVTVFSVDLNLRHHQKVFSRRAYLKIILTQAKINLLKNA